MAIAGRSQIRMQRCECGNVFLFSVIEKFIDAWRALAGQLDMPSGELKCCKCEKKYSMPALMEMVGYDPTGGKD